jgi:hypothetical protein
MPARSVEWLVVALVALGALAIRLYLWAPFQIRYWRTRLITLSQPRAFSTADCLQMAFLPYFDVTTGLQRV